MSYTYPSNNEVGFKITILSNFNNDQLQVNSDFKGYMTIRVTQK